MAVHAAGRVPTAGRPGLPVLSGRAPDPRLAAGDHRHGTGRRRQAQDPQRPHDADADLRRAQGRVGHQAGQHDRGREGAEGCRHRREQEDQGTGRNYLTLSRNS